MRCEHCGGELVEVDNPMRREVRHRRGVVCPGGRSENASTPTDHSAETPLSDSERAAIRGAIEHAELLPDGTLPLAFSDRKRLLAEVDRLRDELAEVKNDREEYGRLISSHVARLEEVGADRDALAAKLDQFRSFPTEPGPGVWSTSYRMGYADASRDVRAVVRALDPAPESPRPPAQSSAERLPAPDGGTETGTPVSEPHDSAQESDWPDVDGWTIAPHPDGVAVYDTTDHPALSGLTIPLGAVLAFIADQEPEEDDPPLSLIPAELVVRDPGICSGRPTMRGTRILAEKIAFELTTGSTWEELKRMYPSLPVPSEEDTDER